MDGKLFVGVIDTHFNRLVSHEPLLGVAGDPTTVYSMGQRQ
jgi:hypothetical protein